MDNYAILEPGESITLFDTYTATSNSNNTAIVKVLFVMIYNRITVYFVSNSSGQSVSSNATTNRLDLTLTRVGPNTGVTLYSTSIINMQYNTLPSYTLFSSESELLMAADDGNWSGSTVLYPITYSYSNSTVSGPSEAAVGDTVVVSAVPDVDYGITDASSQISVTNDDVAVPYTWDAMNQRITFTMPQPVENRGGFGSTGQ